MENKVAVLLVFADHVDKEAAQRWIDTLKHNGMIENHSLKEFDAVNEYPVLYFP